MHITAEEIVRSQRTDRGKTYERLVELTRRKFQSGDSQDVEEARYLKDAFLQIRSVSPGQVHSNALLTNLSLAYQNDEYIGERLMPPVIVAKRSDDFATYPKRERFAFPDDALGTRARASEVNESRSSSNYSVRDYGLENYLDAATIDNQDPVFDEMVDLVEAPAEGVAFKREKRIAAVLTGTSNFASGNTATLSGADQWDHASGGNPVKNLIDAKSALWQGRGPTDIIAYSGLEVYNVLARHAAIRDLFKNTVDGLATRQQIAQYFGFADYLVGAAREDTANEGQTASYGRIWGKYFGIVRVARRPSRRSAHFGSTFRLSGDPVTTQWFDPAVGKKGGYYAKVAVSEDHKVVANDTGYLFASVIS